MRNKVQSRIIKVALIVIFTISTFLAIYKFNFKYVEDSDTKNYTLKIIEKVKQDENVITYLIKNNKDKFVLNICKSKYGDGIDLSKYSDYTYGDILKIRGKITIPKVLGNPHEFDYKKYLNAENICGIINTYKEPEKLGKETNPFTYINYLKEYTKQIISESMNKENIPLTLGYIYGDKSEITEETSREYSILGISHMLVASGTNIAILIIVMKRICKKLKLNKAVTNILTILKILLFVSLCNFEYSILKAGIIGITTLVLGMWDKKISSLKKILICLYIMYITNPADIFSVSMQLSFFASLGIIFFYSKIEVRINWILKQKLKKRIYDILKYPIKIFCISIAVKILTLPLTINNFNSIPLFGIFTSVIVSIVICVIKILGIIATIFLFIPGVSNLIFSIMNPIVSSVSVITQVLGKIAIEIQVPVLPSYIVITYYIYILCIILKDRIVIKNFNQSIKFNKVCNICKKYLMYILILCFVIYKTGNIFNNNYAIFFNVRQGDMAFIKYMSGTILIDAGSKNDKLSENVFLNFCKKENIQSIDLIVISHFHTDHINGIAKIAEEVNVKKIIYGMPKVIDDEYLNFIKWTEKVNIEKTVVQKGDNITVGDIKMCILSPGTETIWSDDIANSNSLVCLLEIQDSKLLFMGDATKETENILLKEENLLPMVDVIKVGHHGSKTSTGNEFVKRISPYIAVISSQKKTYGHPSRETLEILKKWGVNEYITEKNGAIKIRF